VKKRSAVVYAALIVLVGLTPLVANASSAPVHSPAQEATTPTTTPNDPGWLAFATARDALEAETNQDLTYVRSWTYEEAEFQGGMDDCRTLGEDEQPSAIFFGWRVVITTLNGRQYEVRTSFNYKIVTICDQVTTVAAAPTAAPSSNLPAPVTGSAVSGSFELGGQVIGGLTPSTQAALKAAKMTWVKVQLPVGSDGSGLISSAHAAGFKILFSVLGDKSQVMNPSYQDTYAAFVAGLAAAGADGIEIWNEMNIDREWPADQISGANYVPLLAKAYNAIKAAHPSTLVITGALSPSGYWGTAGCNLQNCTSSYCGCNDDIYAQQMAAAGAGNYADCIGVHYNEAVVSPQQSSGDPRSNYPTYYYGTMLSRAIGPFGGKQACFTELGYLTPEGYGTLPGGFTWAQNTTIAQQAAWLAEAAVLSATSGKVRLMIVWNVDSTLWGADPQAGYAIIRKDGTCPACTTLQNIRTPRSLAGASFAC
jgi:hypothetical protein